MTESNPYRPPSETEPTGESPVPSNALSSKWFEIFAVLLIAWGLMLETASYVPPRPTSTIVLEVAAFVFGAGFLFVAHRRRRL